MAVKAFKTKTGNCHRDLENKMVLFGFWGHPFPFPCLFPSHDPARIVVFHADFGIVFAGLGRGEKDQHGGKTSRLVRAPDEFLADPLMLKSNIHRQIG